MMINPYTFNKPVQFVQAGTKVNVSTGTTMDVPVVGTPVSGNLLMIQIGIGSLTPTIPTAPSGWTKLFEDTDGTFIQQYIYYKYSNGTETGNITFTFSTTVSNFAIGIMYEFVNMKSSAPFNESGGLIIGTLNYGPASITSTIANSLALSFVFLPGLNTTGAYTGNSGGTWIEKSSVNTTLGSDGVLQLQSADLPKAGTISGGSFNSATGGLSLTRSFSLKAK